MDTWERFEASASRDLQGLGFQTSNLEVYEPDIAHTAGHGYDVTYPGTADHTILAGIEPPSSVSDRDEGGTTIDADIVLYVDDGTAVTWTGYGESGTGDVEANAEVVLDSGDRYAITDVEDQQDGLLRLLGASIPQ